MERGGLVFGPAFGVAVHPDAAGVEQVPHATVRHAGADRLERQAVETRGLVLRTESGMHHRVVVLEIGEKRLGLLEVTDHWLDAQRGDELGALFAAHQTLNLAIALHQSSGDCGSQISRRTGHEHPHGHTGKSSPRP